MGGLAWVTLATNDSYSLGALVLAHSLKQAGTKQQLAVLITPGVTTAMREKLSTVFNVVQEVNVLDSRDEANLRLLKRPELGITFTKLHCWRLTQFDKCVFLDADTLVLQNCDELFEREELSAAPDVGWPDCFNSGVFVYQPSNETYEKLITFALETGSFDGGDQGLLNLYFSDWAHKDISKHLPFIYNLCSTACYSYLPAFKQFGGNAKIIHFIGATKPWLQYFNTEIKKVQPSGDSTHLTDVLQRWWDIFCSLIHPQLTPDMAGLAGAFAQLTLGVARTPEQIALDDILRRQAWELGNVDYLGRDSFDKIWTKIEETLSLGQEPVAEVAPEADAKLPKEPTTSSTASEVKTPQAQPEAIPDVIQETATPVKESKEQVEPQTQRISTVAIPSPSLKDSLEPAVKPTKTEPLPPIALPPPEDHTLAEVAAQEIPQVSAVAEPVKPTPEQIVPTPEAAVPEATVPAPEAVAPTPVLAQEPVVVSEEPPKELPLPTPQEPVDLPKETAPLQTQAEVPVVEPQTVLSTPVSSVVDTQKPVEKVKPAPELTKKSDAVEPLATKPVEAVTEPTKTEPIASKPETPQPTTVQPQQKEVAPEVESCPRPTPKTEEVAAPPTEPVKTHKEGVKGKKVAKEPSSDAAKAPPAAKVTEATPPTSPPVLPQLKQTKEALAVDTSIPDTPPPAASEGAAATPVPPPRKTTGGPKKPSSKTKK